MNEKDTRKYLLGIDIGTSSTKGLLAGVGAGIWDSVEKACAKTIHVKERVRPQKKWIDFYSKKHSVFQSLYVALKPSFPIVTGHSAKTNSTL